MKKLLKILVILIVLGIIGGVAGYHFIYNKPHPNIEKQKPDYTLTAQELFDAYRNDARSASEKYNGKVIEITGYVTAVEGANDLTIAVFGMDEGIFGVEGIRITMLDHHHESIKNHDLSKKIKIKGLNDGFNDPDVIIRQGSVVK
jgi:hypothetical protein